MLKDVIKLNGGCQISVVTEKQEFSEKQEF